MLDIDYLNLAQTNYLLHSFYFIAGAVLIVRSALGEGEELGSVTETEWCNGAFKVKVREESPFVIKFVRLSSTIVYNDIFETKNKD